MSDQSSAEEFPGDTIHIEQLEVFAHVGVPDDERQTPQRITLSLTIWPARDFRDLDDDISRAINYSAIASAIRDFVGERRDRLVETLAEKTAEHLLGRFPIRRIRLELRKFVLPDAAFVSITLTRSNSVD